MIKINNKNAVNDDAMVICCDKLLHGLCVQY